MGSNMASTSREPSSATTLDGVFLNENWKYDLHTETLTDLYTGCTYQVGWLEIVRSTSSATSLEEQQHLISNVIHRIIQSERQKRGMNIPSTGPMRFLDTGKGKQPTLSQMETPSVSPMDPPYVVSPGFSMQSEPPSGTFSFPNLAHLSIRETPTSSPV